MNAPAFNWPRIFRDIPEARHDMVRVAVEKAVTQYLESNLKPRGRLNQLYSAIFLTWEAAQSAPRISVQGPFVRFAQSIIKPLGIKRTDDGIKKFVERERERLACQPIALSAEGRLKADATVVSPGALRFWGED